MINEPAISSNVRVSLFVYPPEATFYSIQTHWIIQIDHSVSFISENAHISNAIAEKMDYQS